MHGTYFLFVLGLLASVAASCGQSPSFVDNTDVNKSSNATPGTQAQGQDAADGVSDTGADDEGTGTEDSGDGGVGTDGTTDSASVDGADGVTDGGTTDGSADGGTTDGSTDGGTTDGSTDGGTTDGSTDGATDGSTGSPADIKKTKTFPTELFGDAQVTATLADPYLTQEIELKRNYTETSTTFKQVVRPGVTDLFTQGNSGTASTESFNQAASKPLDLLVVIDNSNSMQEEQVNLSQRLLPLLSYVNDADWQIGVVTTDSSNGCLRKLIKKGDANATTAFSQAVQAGVNGSGNERGVLQAVNALKCQTNDWVRSVSSLAILIVSDEDNCSDGTGCGSNDYAKKEYLLDYLSSIRVPGVNAKVYGLFWHPTQEQTACSTAFKKANIYAELVADTAGTWGSICDADYSNTLSGISQNIASILDRRFTLKHMPDSGSLQVTIDGIVQTSGYTVSGNVIVFDLPPADGAVVSASYKYGALPLKKTFTLSSQPQDQIVNVQVNGTEVTSGFTYQPANNSIVFNDTPADFAEIKVTYIKSIELAKRFDLGRKYVASSLRVYVNNVETLDFSADPALDNAVTFQAAPPEGATVLFTYTAVGDPILFYPFTVQGRTAQNLTLSDATTGASVGHLYLFGVINILSNEFVEGRKIKARYWNEGRDLTEVVLPAPPVANSVKVTGGTVVCDPSKYTVANSTVSVKKCGFSDSTTTINVDYKYTIERYMSFVFDDPDLGNAKTPLKWRVWVNNVETKEFTVQNTTITLNALLPVGTGNQVKIEVSYQ